ncbi:hypothetical protein E2C01_098234 [Portunus trituberculatus]|uniref:Uncharacterized protein n=1 Tax=Portunus trituberculatus TaxID=210409 RepID=A0A5B7KBL8_PORTR|nr:hypothetical protein [Portunus trituberculatus]
MKSSHREVEIQKQAVSSCYIPSNTSVPPLDSFFSPILFTNPSVSLTLLYPTPAPLSLHSSSDTTPVSHSGAWEERLSRYW